MPENRSDRDVVQPVATRVDRVWAFDLWLLGHRSSPATAGYDRCASDREQTPGTSLARSAARHVVDIGGSCARSTRRSGWLAMLESLAPK